MIIGIDLGTTNSAVAVWKDGRAQLAPNGLGHVLTPSAVSVGDDGEVLVGLAARERQATHPNHTVTAFKRYMGSQRETKLGKKSFLPEELSALVLRSLKADAEAFLGEPVTEAVITVPAYFNDKQRKATRRAGELAGLKVERLLNEPTAAALAYGIHQLDDEDERRFLVFDLGGGTFDVSIIELFEGVIEVRASTGDNRLGGEDFNEVLIEMMRRRFDDDWKGAGRDDDLYQRLREAAERGRRELTGAAQTVLAVIWKDKRYELPVTAEDFELEAKALLDRLREPVLRALRDSEIPVDGLREIVLVGGSTRMPVVRRAMTKMFGRFPSNAINPDEAVALGAAVQAGLKARDAALGEVVMTDVCPYTLGVETSDRGPGGNYIGGVFSPIIERNTVVPASRVSSYVTLQDNQKFVEFNIYQGESRRVSENVHLGQVRVPTPPRKAGEVELLVRFTYDINGLLEVDVHVPASGEHRQKVIVDAEGMDEKEMETRRQVLETLKVHPRDTEANQAAMARANRCYENALGETRDYVGGLMAKFTYVLERQDPRLVDAARETLLAELDVVEGETWL